MSEFQTLMKALCAPFPSEAHQPRYDGNGTYIPIHCYIDRLNEVAGCQWSHERVGEPVFYMDDQFVHTVVKVTIAGRSHMGEGFSKFQLKSNGLIQNRHYAIRSATKDAIRDAITYFGMGRSSILQNSNLSDSNSSIEKEQDVELSRCMKCNQVLVDDDILLLNKYNVKFNYCQVHLPKHFIK